ncbi:MAG: TetR/AcrR family transcriptional regulator [Edaphobacter sp.]
MRYIVSSLERISTHELAPEQQQIFFCNASVGNCDTADAMNLPKGGQMSKVESKNRGRQRSEESEEAILTATLHLLKEKPLRDIAIEEIARKAGVGKATIYKWWPSKAYVALDAFLRTMNRMVPTPDTGTGEEDFKVQLHSLITFYNSPTGRIFSQFLAEGQIDREFASLFRERFLKPRREAVGVIFDRAVKRGEIDPSVDRELGLDLIYGPAIFRLMAGHSPLDPEAAEAMISTLFRGMGNKSFKNRSVPRKYDLGTRRTARTI